jgi:hypothetical protein
LNKFKEMQRTIVYLLLLLILGGGVYFFIFRNGEENLFDKKEAGFTVKDTSDIGRIFLVKTNGESITLTRTDSAWMLNNRYKARRGTVAGLLGTLTRQEAMYPVPEASHNGVVKVLSGNSIKVELYDRDGERMRVFYVGGQANNYEGTYMLMENAKRPYVVNIPNFHGFLTPIYSTDLAEWRELSVFRLQPDEIKEVSVQYAEEPLNSFTIKQDGKLTVDIHPELMAGKSLNEERAKAYLRFFDNVNCEGYLNGIDHLDSIISSVPLICKMDVISKAGRHQHIDIYRMPINKRSKNLRAEIPSRFDIDRMYATMNNYRDTVIIQSYTFNKLFRKGFEFYEQDPPKTMMGIEAGKK